MILRLMGGVVVVGLAASCAILEVFYLPLRAGTIPVPISIPAAVVGNVVFTRALYIISGSVWPALLPGAVWLAVIARAAIARPEGDLLITGSATTVAINVAFLGFGSLALAFTVGRLQGRRRATQGLRESSAAPPETAGSR